MLQLLTYADLENLRQRRNLSTLGTKPSPTSGLQSKRYLILTYSTEFDRIHYPLALPYVGKPDPVELQETVRHLQQELDKYKSKVRKDEPIGCHYFIAEDHIVMPLQVYSFNQSNVLFMYISLFQNNQRSSTSSFVRLQKK